MKYFAILVTLVFLFSPVSAAPLAGKVSEEQVLDQPIYVPKPIVPTEQENVSNTFAPSSNQPSGLALDQLKTQSPATDSYQIPDVSRPAWIPAHAYTNDNMVAHYFNLFPWLRFGQPIPNSGTDARMLRSLACYWKDGHYGACQIHCTPVYGYPGNFTFYTINDINGPNGWLEDTGQVKDRQRLYRYWFDQ